MTLMVILHLPPSSSNVLSYAPPLPSIINPTDPQDFLPSSPSPSPRIQPLEPSVIYIHIHPHPHPLMMMIPQVGEVWMAATTRTTTATPTSTRLL